MILIGFESRFLFLATAFATLAGGALLIWKRPARPAALRIRLAGLITLAALVVAVGRPYLIVSGDPDKMIHVLDVSASIRNPDALAHRMHALESAFKTTRHAEIAFADVPVVLKDFDTRAEYGVGIRTSIEGLDRMQTNPSRALAGIPAVSDGSPCDIILYSDGLFDASEKTLAVAAAERLRRSGYTLNIVTPVESIDYDAAVMSVNCPPFSRAGQPVAIEATVAATGKGRVKVAMRRIVSDRPSADVDAVIVDFKQAGEFKVTLTDPPPKTGARIPGIATYEIRVEAFDRKQALTANDAVRVSTDIIPLSLRVLLIAASGSAAPAHLDLFESSGAFKYDRILPRDLEKADLSEYRVIVMDNIGRNEITDGGWAEIRDAVIRGGTGLLYIGGPRGFAAGGHQRHGPLETILPVTMLPEERKRTLLVLVLDVSGSMSETYTGNRYEYKGMKKIEILKSAVNRMMYTPSKTMPLKPDDRIAFVLFDSAIRNPDMRPIPLKDYERIRKTIVTATAAGKTNVYAAVAHGVDIATRSTAEHKLILLISDGRPEGAGKDFEITQYENLENLVDQRISGAIKKRGWVFGALYMGDKTDPDERQYFHKLQLLTRPEYGGGGCSEIDPAQLFDQLKKWIETARAGQTVTRIPSRPFKEPAYANTLLYGLPDWPVVGFRNRVGMKPTGRRVMSVRPVSPSSDSGAPADPWIAVGESGMGRAAAWCGPLVDAEHPYNGRAILMARLLDYLRGEPPRGYSVIVRTTRSGSEIRVIATGMKASRPKNPGNGSLPATRLAIRWGTQSVHRRILTATAPGRWQTTLSQKDAPAGRFSILDANTNVVLARGFFSEGIKPELTVIGVDTGALSVLARAGGGRVFDDIGKLAAIEHAEARRTRKRDLTADMFALAALAFLLELFFRYRSPLKANGVPIP